MGKRILRPGGIALSRAMLQALAIGPTDDLVEYAPGLGATARMALEFGPASYIGIEKDEAAARRLDDQIRTLGSYRCVVGDATDYDLLPAESASVVYGESMLTIHNPQAKRALLQRVLRTLRPGGRFAFQELSLLPPDIDAGLADTIRRELISVVRHSAWPLTTAEWRELVTEEGFLVVEELQAPAELLEAGRIIEDEGAENAVGFFSAVLEDPEAVERFRAMRAAFRAHQTNLCGYGLVCRKPY
ncbi:MAG: class I SAM-dependent methyltransferase [Spirochaetota bacterium]